MCVHVQPIHTHVHTILVHPHIHTPILHQWQAKASWYATVTFSALPLTPTRSTLTRVCNLHNSSADGVFYEWRSNWLPRGTNNLFLCKLQVLCKGAAVLIRVQPLWYHSLCKNMLISLCYYNPDSVSNQPLRHLSTLPLWRLHTLINVLLHLLTRAQHLVSIWYGNGDIPCFPRYSCPM